MNELLDIGGTGTHRFLLYSEANKRVFLAG